MTNPQEPHSDLLSATRTLLQHIGAMVKFNHIKGHEDLHTLGPFTHDATLNIEADSLARTKLPMYTTGLANFHILWSQGV